MELKIIIILIAMMIPLVIKEQQDKPELNVKEVYEIEKETSFKSSDKKVTVNEFIQNREHLLRKGYDTEGVYVITNETRDNYKYVGQSVNLIRRVNSHIKGRGNNDIYNDMRHGDKFTIELLRLKDTNYISLNDLERNLIRKNDSYYNGYNKTRGNR